MKAPRHKSKRYAVSARSQISSGRAFGVSDTPAVT